jgi:hypothetical protein
MVFLLKRLEQPSDATVVDAETGGRDENTQPESAFLAIV